MAMTAEERQEIQDYYRKQETFTEYLKGKIEAAERHLKEVTQYGVDSYNRACARAAETELATLRSVLEEWEHRQRLGLKD